jgi:PiT family inorganic phosphate transporter
VNYGFGRVGRAGATKRLSAVRWGVAGNILMAWVLTFPGAAAIAAVSYWIVNAIVRT